MLALSLVLAFALPVERPGLAIHADPCLELDDAELLETIELRLGAGPEYRQDSGRPGDTRLLLDCGLGTTVELTVIDPISDATLIRTIEAPREDRRAERIAEHAVNLVRAAWLSVALERPDEDRRTRTRRTASRVARRPSSPWELGDGFIVRSFLDSDSPSLMLGEQVEVVHRPLRHLAWKADGELGFWRVPVDEDATIATLSISAAPALLGWGEIPGRGKRGAGTVALYAGAGFRAGGVRMRSEALGNSRGFRSFAGPLAMARASVALGRFVGLAVDIEAGWLLHGPERPNGVPLSLRGPWVNGVIVIVSRF